MAISGDGIEESPVGGIEGTTVAGEIVEVDPPAGSNQSTGVRGPAHDRDSSPGIHSTARV